MKVLLDTHVFLWWINNDARLSESVFGTIKNPKNEVFFSAASGWEISIKASLGRIAFRENPEKFIPEQLRMNSFSPLPVQLFHALYVFRLPWIHRDPFDRLLIAQSLVEKIPIITNDNIFKNYGIEVLW